MKLGAVFLRAAGVAALVAATSHAPACGSSAPSGSTVVWVRFADRGRLERAPVAMRREAALAAVSLRSLERRHRRGAGVEVFESDLPVEAGYVRALADRGFRVRVVSRWLNAASVETAPARLAELAALPFVRAVEPSPRARRMEPDVVLPAAETAGAPLAVASSANPGDPSFYGLSFAQNRVVEVDSLHAAGLSGQGVIVAMLDTGFRETHVVFDSLLVMARYDFIHADTVVANEAGQDGAGQDSHGTNTLSIIAANLAGRMVGPAFRARYALAKTEDVTSETPVEMDYWQAAAEWADSLGADVISSSLGYSEFDNAADSYTYADMDGRTTVVTLAAAEAARRGIVVVTAQGNEGNIPWHYLIAPADAESVLAVGATDSTGVVTGFSSYGPSADGRVKPDVSGMGSFVALVTPGSDSTITHGNGTSYSTPEIAGLAALLLEAHPTWTPFEVIESLRATATRFDTPDDRVGFGVARGARAVAWTPSTVFASTPAGAPALVFAGPVPVLRGEALTLWMRAGSFSGLASVFVFDTRGRRVRSLFEGPVLAGSQRLLSWDGRDAFGTRAPAGVYFVQFAAPGVRLGRRLILL
jgi:subtilisin family serine protease